MQDGSTYETGATVENPNNEGRNEEGRQFLPVRDASSHIQHGQYIVGLAEKFIPGSANGPRCAENEQEYDEQHSYDTPDDIGLREERFCYSWLRLVELSFDETPAEAMDCALNKDNVAEPSVEEVEALVRYTSHDRKHGLPAREQDGQRCESVSHNTNTIREWTQGRASVEKAWELLHRRLPDVVRDADESKDRDVTEEGE